MSAPPENRLPAPASTMARTPSSGAARSSASSNAERTACEKLFTGGFENGDDGCRAVARVIDVVHEECSGKCRCNLMKHHLRLRLLSSFAKPHSAQRNHRYSDGPRILRRRKIFPRRNPRLHPAEPLANDVAAKVLGHKRLSREDIIGWHRILHTRGWSAPTWPKEFGGPGWTAVEQHIFDEECTAAGAPPVIAFGVRMVAPVIMKYGSAAQQQFFLPRILSGEHWWCQGYTEPGAGSDLASLKTTAVRRGDTYVVNGQKTWNTLGHFADWMFCLARTSTEGRSQEGISFLLIDMKTKGISVRPIALIDGEYEVNEVWLDDVEVPVDAARRRGEQGLDVREVPADARAREHRAAR